jgi:hypothetical protein
MCSLLLERIIGGQRAADDRTLAIGLAARVLPQRKIAILVGIQARVIVIGRLCHRARTVCKRTQLLVRPVLPVGADEVSALAVRVASQAIDLTLHARIGIEDRLAQLFAVDEIVGTGRPDSVVSLADEPKG